MLFKLIDVTVGKIEGLEGAIVEKTEPGLELEIDGKVVQVPFQKIDSSDLDAEDPEEATVFYVEYQGEDYELELPEKGTEDWDDLLFVMCPD